MKFRFLFIILFFIFSCTHRRPLDLAKEFYAKIQNESLEDFFKVEFGTRGDVELWTYYLNSDYNSTYTWAFYIKKDSFDLTTHPNYEQFKKEIIDPLMFVKALENKKNRLKITAISNSPWPGHFVKFWFSANDALIYNPEEFTIDSDSKKRWMNEFKSGILISKNWVYFNLRKQ